LLPLDNWTDPALLDRSSWKARFSKRRGIRRSCGWNVSIERRRRNAEAMRVKSGHLLHKAKTPDTAPNSALPSGQGVVAGLDGNFGLGYRPATAGAR